MEGIGVGMKDLSLTHTSALSVVTSLPGSVLFLHGSSCNHFLPVMWRGDGTMLTVVIHRGGFPFLHSTCVSFFHLLHQQSTKETENTECQLGVSLCMFFSFLVCCYFHLLSPPLFICFFFPLTKYHRSCCVSGCLLTDNCKEVVFTGFTQAESSILS